MVFVLHNHYSICKKCADIVKLYILQRFNLIAIELFILLSRAMDNRKHALFLGKWLFHRNGIEFHHTTEFPVTNS